MEAVGALASIIGVAGAGAKLSIVLFEFASTVGSAGQEIRQIGIEISLFCSVLKQLQSTLTKAKAYRYSLSALETTQEILNRCQEVFKEIGAIVNSLRKRSGERSPEAPPDWIARVKWTFKRSQVQLLRTTLESCKVTLHIMLSTLEFAQKIASRRISTVETQAEDEHEETMTRSLVIAHQCTIEILQRLEEEEVQQQPKEGGPLSPPLTPGTSPLGFIVRGPTGHKSPRSFDNQNFKLLSPSADPDKKRTSVWINNLIFDNSPLPPGFRRQTWGDAECSLLLDQQPYYFLQKWTDQGEHLKELQRKIVDDPLKQVLQTDLADGKTMETKSVALEHSEPPLSLAMRLQTDPMSPFITRSITRSSNKRAPPPKFPPFTNPTAQSGIDKPIGNAENPTSVENLPTALRKYNLEEPLGPETPPRSKAGIVTIAPGTVLDVSTRHRNSLEMFDFFRPVMEQPCHKVMPAVLKRCNIKTPWEEYSLWIAYDHHEKCVKLDEKPFMIFESLLKEGKKPIFMLKKGHPEGYANLLRYLQMKENAHHPTCPCEDCISSIASVSINQVRV